MEVVTVLLGRQNILAKGWDTPNTIEWQSQHWQRQFLLGKRKANILEERLPLGLQ